MTTEKIAEILHQTAYVRTGGSEDELRCAQTLQKELASLGISSRLEDFSVPKAELNSAVLTCDGEEIPCKGYLCAGCADVEAPLYYLRTADPVSLSQCRGKIVLIDGYLRYWMYRDLLEHGAVGFLTYDGNIRYPNRDIDQRELRAHVHEGQRLPGVHINVHDALRLIQSGARSARICLDQTETVGWSRNVVAELPGQTEQYILVCAHYDTTWLSEGAYDNMSGVICALGIAEAYRQKPRKYGLRIVLCGSEERGLLGSKAYAAAHGAELERAALCVNLDMLGCTMGGFTVCCTCEERMAHFMEYYTAMEGFAAHVDHGIRSSDSNSFADCGVPAVSFARYAPGGTASIHDRYDTREEVSPAQLETDTAFISTFVCRMADAAQIPVSREIPDVIRRKLDEYFNRIRTK